MTTNILKWTAAVLSLGIALLIVVPLAVSSALGVFEFSDESGLLDALLSDDGPSGDPLDEFDDAGGTVEDAEASAEDAEDDRGTVELDTPSSYTVQAGDTLFSIAAQVYDDGNRWPDIAEANDYDDSSELTVGDELVIP